MTRIFRNSVFFSVIMGLMFISGVTGCSKKQTSQTPADAPTHATVAKPPKPVIAWDSEKITVDGKPYFIRGINCDSDDFANLRQIRKDAKLLKELNVNTVRLFSEPSREVLDIFYEFGIMAIVSLNNNGAYAGHWTLFDSDSELNKYVKLATEQVNRIKDHPAMLMWCIWNDGPFGTKATKRYNRATMESFLKRLAMAVKEADPSHPITCANMPTSGYMDLGADFLDVIGFNNYAGLHGEGEYTHSTTLKWFDMISQIGKQYQKPVILTETGYSTVINPEIQGPVIRSLVSAACRTTAGVCVFMFADNWGKSGNPAVQDPHVEEYWGILTKAREPKTGFFALKEAYAKIAQSGPQNANIEPISRTNFQVMPQDIEAHRIIEDFELDKLDSNKLTGIYKDSSTLKAEISPERFWGGMKSLKLTYTPSAISSWGVAVMNFDEVIPENAKGLGMWIYCDGSQNSLIVQLTDQDRDLWSDMSLNCGEKGWTYYVINFSNLKRRPHGSSETANCVFDKGTVREFGFIFQSVASQTVSTVYVDAMELYY